VFRKTKNEIIGDFAKIFLFLALLYGFFALPRFLFEDLKIIEVCLDLGFLSGFFAIAYLLSISFKLYFRTKLPSLAFFGIITTGVIFVMFDIFNLQPAFRHFYHNFVFWSENRPLLINIMGGTIFSLFSFGGAFLFLQGGLKSDDRKIKTRAFLISAAMTLCGLMSGIRFVFSFLMDIFFSTLIALSIGALSVFCLIAAIFFIKIQKEEK